MDSFYVNVDVCLLTRVSFSGSIGASRFSIILRNGAPKDALKLTILYLSNFVCGRNNSFIYVHVLFSNQPKNGERWFDEIYFDPSGLVHVNNVFDDLKEFFFLIRQEPKTV